MRCSAGHDAAYACVVTGGDERPIISNICDEHLRWMVSEEGKRLMITGDGKQKKATESVFEHGIQCSLCI